MNNLDSLAESIGQLYAMQNADNDQRAVELYRAMFRNDKDINNLDFNYADHILEYVEFGCSNPFHSNPAGIYIIISSR